MIYLDNSATTKPNASVVQSFQKVAEEYFANPSSIHELGGEVEKLQQRAREQVANLLHVESDEIVFTSGGTESNNLAIKGIALKYANRGKHIITSQIEHASVYDAFKSMEEFGFTVTYLPVNEKGIVEVEAVEAAITDETILLSIMHVNNETGAIQPIEEIGEIAKKHPKLFFHVDAVQALGKVPIKLSNSGIDFASFSGHKIHGLKGTGVLYIKKGIILYPLFHGGNQERSIRSGTENVPGNVSVVRAIRLILEKEQNDYKHLRNMHGTLLSELNEISGVHVNTLKDGAPHIINVSVPGIKPEVIIHALYEKGVVISTQSACSSKQFDKSRVLEAAGASEEIANSGLRISLAYETSMEEIEQFIRIFKQTVEQLKEILE